VASFHLLVTPIFSTVVTINLGALIFLSVIVDVHTPFRCSYFLTPLHPFALCELFTRRSTSYFLSLQMTVLM